jgi:DNA-binding PadR family transcriptional regulator
MSSHTYSSAPAAKGPRVSVLSRALLGLLAAEPMSGYGLARFFERTLARTWPAQHPQIYPALAALQQDGLIRVSEEGPRRRKTYAVTEDGLDAVQLWLRESAPDRPVRNEAILRVFLLWLLGADEAMAFFDDEIEVHQRRLARFEELLADDEQRRREHGPDGTGFALCAGLALEWGLRYERGYTEWANWARDQIAARATEWDRDRQGRDAAVVGRLAPERPS